MLRYAPSPHHQTQVPHHHRSSYVFDANTYHPNVNDDGYRYHYYEYSNSIAPKDMQTRQQLLMGYVTISIIIICLL